MIAVVSDPVTAIMWLRCVVCRCPWGSVGDPEKERICPWCGSTEVEVISREDLGG